MKLLQQLHPLMEGSKTEKACDRALLLRIWETSPKDSEALEDKELWTLVREHVRPGNALLIFNKSDPDYFRAHVAKL